MPLTYSAYSAQPSAKSFKIASVRDNAWLLSRLSYIWDNFFSDIDQVNPVKVKFGRYSRYRLGSIKYTPTTKQSTITLTGMFKKDSIPVSVVDQTIAHELCHYAHGFSSPKIRLHKYPHHGGVINTELKKRGLECLTKAYTAWVKEYKKTL